MKSTVPAEPLLRWSVGLVWLATALLCAHPTYRAIGASYLARLHLSAAWMYAACVGEALLALVILTRPLAASLVALQVAAVAAFTTILAALEPMLLVNPFGVLSKNLPLALVVLASGRLARGADLQRRVLPLLRAAAALPWFTEGLFPKLLFQQTVELAMVPAIGITSVRPGLLVGAMGVLQVLSGVLVLALRGRPRRALRYCQAAALVGLPLVVGLLEPTLWVHPFGPFTKNLPILAATWVVVRSGED